MALLLGEKRKTKIDRKPKGTKDNKGGDTEGKVQSTRSYLRETSGDFQQFYHPKELVAQEHLTELNTSIF